MSNDTAGAQFDAFRRICLPMILAVGLFTPSLIIFLLEITLGDIPPLESLRDIAHRQFAEGHNLFLLAVIGLIPFGVLAVVLRALSNKLMGLHLAIFAICGLAGILTLMIPAHVSLWRPLYTDEHASSTAVIAFLFIPFYCIMSMGAGIIVASIIFIPRWIREAKKNNPYSGPARLRTGGASPRGATLALNTMKRLIQTIATPLFGILIVISGFVYDVLFAGIPYQDPTPELQARYDFHSAVAGWFYQGGGVVLLIGLLAIPITLKKTKPTR